MPDLRRRRIWRREPDGPFYLEREDGPDEEWLAVPVVEGMALLAMYERVLAAMRDPAVRGDPTYLPIHGVLIDCIERVQESRDPEAFAEARARIEAALPLDWYPGKPDA